MAFRIVLVLATLLLSACGTTSVGLRYTPKVPPAKVSGIVAPVVVGGFVDQRGESPKWIGAIRGGYGNPLKVLETEQPVSELVQKALAEGLRSRGITVTEEPGHSRITGVIRKFECSQYVRREAFATIEIAVADPAGKQRYSREFNAEALEGSIVSLSTGIFASVDDLRLVMEQTMNDLVDQVLRDEGFLAALR
ncbi:MAG: hypothetical protein FIA97_01135 [Methylococcaceae bacterium]|nr:hypothetical protein [Methylococcaceae bacterium]